MKPMPTKPAARAGNNSEAGPPVAARKKSRVSKALMHWTRRVHLYGGLLMLPWVFLYGVTGFLFNHHGIFSGEKNITFGPAAMKGSQLENIPGPATIASQVVAAINSQDKGEYRLVEPSQARFERGGLRIGVKGSDQKMYNVFLQADGTGGSVFPDNQTSSRQRGRAPFAAREGVTLSESPVPQLEQGTAEILDRIGMEGATVTRAQVSPLSFLMENKDGERWRVNYNTEMGSVSGQVVDKTAETGMTFESFLLRLHMAHHYPSVVNIRWIWAVIVDVMAGIMVFWGISGVIMWWQIKRTRWLGASLLFAAIAITAAVGPLMYDAIVLNGR